MEGQQVNNKSKSPATVFKMDHVVQTTQKPSPPQLDPNQTVRPRQAEFWLRPKAYQQSGH